MSHKLGSMNVIERHNKSSKSNKRVETLRGAGTTEHLYNVVLLSRDRLKVT